MSLNNHYKLYFITTTSALLSTHKLFLYQVKVTFDDFSAGSGTTKNGPDHDAPEPQGPPRGNGSDAKSKNDKKNKTTDNYEGDIFDADSDEHLNKLLKEFGASHDDVKEVKVDLDLTKP